jgi:putative ABC transport system permease protein
MDIREPFRAAFVSLKANKLRSALTTLGIVIGVSAVIIVVSLIQGLKGSVMGQIEAMGSNSLFVRPATPMDMPIEDFQKIKNRDLTLDDMRALTRMVPQIIGVTPVFFTGGEVKNSGRSTNTQIFMTDETWIEQNKVDLALGRNFVPADMRLRSKVAIIGPRLIEKLGISGNPIGQFISALDMSFEVVGVLKEQGASIGSDDDNALVIPITTGMATLPDHQRRQLFFQARFDPKLSADDAEDIVREALRRIRGVKPNEIEGFRVFTQKQIASMVDTIAGAITAVAGGMVGIALLVGGVGIMNIMLVSVTERTREIGVRKAVGAKRVHILVQFLIEASVLSLLGGALGILFGFLAGAAIGKMLLNQVGGIPLWAFIAGFGVPAAIGVLFGLYPAAKASKLDPIESLRYE